MSDKIEKKHYCEDMKKFAKWLTKAVPHHPLDNDRPWIFPISGTDSTDADLLFDHGFIIGRVLELGEALNTDLSGIEFGIVARTYAPHLIDTPPEGLRVIRIPYPEDYGDPVLIVPEGPGAGTISFLYALRYMTADYFSCALPLPMQYRIVVGHDYEALSNMHISLTPREQ